MHPLSSSSFTILHNLLIPCSADSSDIRKLKLLTMLSKKRIWDLKFT